jgi:hypothetical protein
MMEWWLEQMVVTKAEVALGIVFLIMLCVFEVLPLSEGQKRKGSQPSEPEVERGDNITTDDYSNRYARYCI